MTSKTSWHWVLASARTSETRSLASRSLQLQVSTLLTPPPARLFPPYLRLSGTETAPQSAVRDRTVQSQARPTVHISVPFATCHDSSTLLPLSPLVSATSAPACAFGKEIDDDRVQQIQTTGQLSKCVPCSMIVICRLWQAWSLDRGDSLVKPSISTSAHFPETTLRGISSSDPLDKSGIVPKASVTIEYYRFGFLCKRRRYHAG
jgi:hypothetical protein